MTQEVLEYNKLSLQVIKPLLQLHFSLNSQTN